MTKEDIIRMAQEAQMPFYWRTGEITYLDKLERFAALVASAERERIKQANAPEIERINAYIKEALAQPEQEPVAFVKGCNRGQWEIFPAKAYQIFEREQPLYTTPPQRTWVGLTRTELIKCGVLPFGMSYQLYEAIEAKLKEKNETN